VPVQAMHASVALLKLAQMPYTGAGTLFIKTILDKKYNLPYKVIDGLVTHFVSFIKRTEDGEEVPTAAAAAVAAGPC
jgi:essential nuclear protein 1